MEILVTFMEILLTFLELFLGLIWEGLKLSDAKINLQRIKDGLSSKGAQKIKIKYLHYRRWGKRTYSLSFENQDGVAVMTEFMIPKHNISAIEWTIPPKDIL